MTASTWTCPTCRAAVVTRYCPSCGERPLEQTLVAHHLESAGTTLDAYAPVFDQALSLHARSLIILMALVFAVFPWLVFHRRRKPFVAHAVLSAALCWDTGSRHS